MLTPKSFLARFKGLSGFRRRLPEAVAAGIFVQTVAKRVQQEWPQIASDINKMLKLKNPIAESSAAGFEFVLAVITFQMQTLPNLMPKEQARRICEYIIQVSSPPDLGTYPREAIINYQNVWNESLKEGNYPFDAIASLLAEKIATGNYIELEGSKYLDPLLIIALSERVVKFGGHWWKDVTRQYKLTQ